MTTTALVLGLALAVPGGQVSPEPPLVVEAHMSTGGVGGQSWSLRVNPSGAVSVRVLYMSDHSGTVLGDFILNGEDMAALREVITEEQFFDLPPLLSPPSIPIHCLTARLTLSLGERRHTVKVNEPAALDDEPEAARFLAVWRKAFASVPLDPSL